MVKYPDHYSYCPTVDTNYPEGGSYYKHSHPNLENTTEFVYQMEQSEPIETVVRKLTEMLHLVEDCTCQFGKARQRGTFLVSQVKLLDKEEVEHRRLSNYFRDRLKTLASEKSV